MSWPVMNSHMQQDRMVPYGIELVGRYVNSPLSVYYHDDNSMLSFILSLCYSVVSVTSLHVS